MGLQGYCDIDSSSVYLILLHKGGPLSVPPRHSQPWHCLLPLIHQGKHELIRLRSA